MNLFSDVRTHIMSCVDKLALIGVLPRGLDVKGIAVEPPRDTSHGDER